MTTPRDPLPSSVSHAADDDHQETSLGSREMENSSGSLRATSNYVVGRPSSRQSAVAGAAGKLLHTVVARGSARAVAAVGSLG